MTQHVSLDTDAAAAYQAAAGYVADLLGSAAEHAETAAAADLSGLGVLGTDFAAAWSAAVTSQGATVRIAAALVDGYRAVIGQHAAGIIGADDDAAAALAAAAARLGTGA